jgi:ABC-type glycerol-3-phosphate transport system substrate-binding protein
MSGTKGNRNRLTSEKIIDEFEAANPNVKVDIQWMISEFMSKVRIAALIGDAPDLIEQSGA